LKQKRTHHAKLGKWLSAGCALALLCVCGSPRVALAQTAASASSRTSAKPATKTATPKKHSQTAAAAAHKGNSKHVSSRKSKKKTARGQQKIDAERAQAIQEALIREHYLSGTAAGTWNQACEDAMRRYQADHGWQSKTVPDSRALISLGLGPSNDHLLNPESAMTTGPASTRAATLTPASHSADPGRMNTNSTPLAEPGTAASSDASRPQ
jgi:hypothetical protein